MTLVIRKAAITGDVRLANICLRGNRSVDRDALDPDGQTPLFLACRGGHYSVARMLLRVGSNANFKCQKSKMTPLHVARSGHYKMLRKLAEAGGDLFLRSSDGLGVMHFSVMAESLAGVREVVELGADLDAQDEYGCACSHCVCRVLL